MTGNALPRTAEPAARPAACRLGCTAGARAGSIGSCPRGGFTGDFATADRERVTVAAFTRRQFADLARATRLAGTFAFLERLVKADFSARGDLHTTGPPSPGCSPPGSPGTPWPRWPPRSREPRCRGRGSTSPAGPVPILSRRNGMTANRVIRASDQDRDSAAELLSEAYAVGRLSRAELDDRATAAYSAKTQGELRDLIADLPGPVARTGLPAETVALPPMRPTADRRQAGEMIWILEFALAAGLAGLVIPPAVWLATVLIPVTLLLLPLALGSGLPAEAEG
jgi:hypothetical protein